MANRLADEKSPYLLQHADNPVDWYPWGGAAFEKASAEDKPVFLSIGYSTCHWCHVMERESFESEEIAAILNQSYVAVKVDREERPDVDRVYMSTVQALTGAGGWPLSVWLTPDRVPYYGGTYFPPEDRYGRPGFARLLRELARMWKEDRDRALGSGRQIVDALRASAAAAGGEGEDLQEAWLSDGFRQFVGSWDRKLGGFGEAPKFPRPSVLNFLLRYSRRTGDEAAAEMVLDTLGKMCAGGIYDHLGGGLHRYSVDAYWRVPHFEKMLYDQAQLVVSLLEAQQISGDRQFGDIAADVLDYVRRDMTAPEGGFYSAEDADSAADSSRPDEKVEGAFYLWHVDEVAEILGPAGAEVFSSAYGLSVVGNTLNDPHGDFGAGNVLYRALSPEQVVERFDRPVGEVDRILEQGRALLMERRARRPRPHLDDKVLTAWNGAMITAFAKGFQVLGRAEDLESARRAATFVRERLWDPELGLSRRYRDGEAGFAGQLEDHAQLIQGLLDLWESDFDPQWLSWAIDLQERSLGLFSDTEGGALFDAVEDPSILVRSRDLYDGAEPSGNSVTALNLLRLSWLVDRPEWRQGAEQILRAAAGHLSRAPHAVPQMLVALDFMLGSPTQVVVAGLPDDPSVGRILEVIRREFMPHRVVMRVDGGPATEFLAEHVPLIADIAAVPHEASAHVCRDYACELPTGDPDALATMLRS